MGKLLKGGIGGGLILFIWGMLSWMVFNWHTETLEKFPDEDVASTFIQQLPTSGVYLLPFTFKLPNTATPEEKTKAMEKNMARKASGPIAFAVIQKEGSDADMVKQMITGLITQIIAALLVTGIVLLRPHTMFTARMFQVILFALAAAAAIYLPYMNWFYFPLNYIVISIIDLVVGWLFASLLIAYVTKPSYPSFK